MFPTSLTLTLSLTRGTYNPFSGGGNIGMTPKWDISPFCKEITLPSKLQIKQTSQFLPLSQHKHLNNNYYYQHHHSFPLKIIANKTYPTVMAEIFANIHCVDFV